MKNYDENNIFSKILKNEIECEKIQENRDNLSFNDINKQAPKYCNYRDLCQFGN